ncbi:hypothetical protein AHAS_Ahas16G0228800 [Arachis hypogaea]
MNRPDFLASCSLSKHETLLQPPSSSRMCASPALSPLTVTTLSKFGSFMALIGMLQLSRVLLSSPSLTHVRFSSTFFYFVYVLSLFLVAQSLLPLVSVNPSTTSSVSFLGVNCYFSGFNYVDC